MRVCLVESLRPCRHPSSAAIRQLFSRFRRRSAPLVIVFSTDERVFVEVSAAVAHTPEPVPAKLCGCHGAPASVTETGHAMLAASEARCMGPGKKLKAKGIREQFSIILRVRYSLIAVDVSVERSRRRPCRWVCALGRPSHDVETSVSAGHCRLG